MLTFENLKILDEYTSMINANMKKSVVKENTTDTEKVMANLWCLTEEVWELASEIRKLTKLNFNQVKVDSFKMEDLEDEASDVLITLVCLLKSVWVTDLNESVNRKIKKNDDRGYWKV